MCGRGRRKHLLQTKAHTMGKRTRDKRLSAVEDDYREHRIADERAVQAKEAADEDLFVVDRGAGAGAGAGEREEKKGKRSHRAHATTTSMHPSRFSVSAYPSTISSALQGEPLAARERMQEDRSAEEPMPPIPRILLRPQQQQSPPPEQSSCSQRRRSPLSWVPWKRSCAREPRGGMPPKAPWVRRRARARALGTGLGLSRTPGQLKTGLQLPQAQAQARAKRSAAAGLRPLTLLAVLLLEKGRCLSLRRWLPHPAPSPSATGPPTTRSSPRTRTR